MFEPVVNNTAPGMNSNPRFPHPSDVQSQPFLFRKRLEKIDWRRLAAIDVNRVASQVDVETLQEILSSVAFCDITNEIDIRYTDTNFVKLFQLAQLLIEYLLYSQDYLTASLNSLREENAMLKKNEDQLQNQLKEKTNRLSIVRRECHRRRLLLLAQQQLMDSGPQSYHRCTYCPKAFLNASFLAAHIHRRHPELEQQQQASARSQTGAQNLNGPSNPMNQQDFQSNLMRIINSNTNSSLERDVRDLLNHLKAGQFPLNERMSSPVRDVGPRAERDSNLPEESPTRPSSAHSSRKSPRLSACDPKRLDVPEPIRLEWQKQLMESHQRDMENLRNTFEKELRSIQAQHTATQQELAELKAKQKISNLGELEDDISDRNQHTPVRISSAKPLTENPPDQENQVPAECQSRSPQILGFTTQNPEIQVSNDAQQKPPLTHRKAVRRQMSFGNASVISSCSSLNLSETQIPSEAQRRVANALASSVQLKHSPKLIQVKQCRSGRTHMAHERPHVQYCYDDGDGDDDDDDRAEQDITAPTEDYPIAYYEVEPAVSYDRPDNYQRICRSPVRDTGYNLLGQSHRRSRFEFKDQISQRHERNDSERSYHANNEHKPRSRSLKRKRKRVRSAAIQVCTRKSQSKCNKNASLEKLSKETKNYGDSPVYLKVKRPYSHSGSSKSSKSSLSPKSRRQKARDWEPVSREIVIVRTEDEDDTEFGRRMDRDRSSDATRSIHLIPTIITSRDGQPAYDHVATLASETRPSNFTLTYETMPRRSRIVAVGESVRHSGINMPGSDQHNGALEETLSQHSRDHVDDKLNSASTMRGPMSIDPIVPDHIGRTRAAVNSLNDTEEQQVSRVMGDILRANESASPAPSAAGSTNILRYSRLLDQLRADPETLSRLRHEVEQLVTEQLTERGINTDQVGLSTPQLNERLTLLVRERERLSRKHPNFFEIREALAQHVDRLARAALRGSTVGLSDPKLNAIRYTRSANSLKSGLPPPAMSSPNMLRKAGTISINMGRVQSPLGISLPTLGTRPESGNGHVQSPGYNLPYSRTMGTSETLSRLQQSSPQLNYHTDEDLAHRPPSSIASKESVRFSQPELKQSNQAPVTSPKQNPRTQSPHRGQNLSAIPNSPPAQFSHDQRVVTFDQPQAGTTKAAKLMTQTSSDEWDSETEELDAIANAARNVSNKPPVTPKQGNLNDDSEVDLDAADALIASLGQRQQNTNAMPVNTRSSIPKTQSIRTDDEDMCSVSSINGNLAEDNSLSLAPESSPRRSGLAGVSRSLDPAVANAHAQLASLGPRPVTRFGSGGRPDLGTKHTSIGSPEFSHTVPTSLWGSNSKALSPGTNVISMGKSEGQLDDLDSDY